MILADFLNLTLDQRAEHVFHFGTFLECCEERGNLYSMSNFYVEVLYNADINMIEDVRGFADAQSLEPYIKEVKVNF